MPKPRIHLALDWDGTMTLDDTTINIGEAHLFFARDLADPPLPPHSYSATPMAEYIQAYQNDLVQWKNSQIYKEFHSGDIYDEVHSWQPNDLNSMERVEQRLTAVREALRLNMEMARAYLAAARHVETSSYLRVRNAVMEVPGVGDYMVQDPMIFEKCLWECGRRDVISGKVKIRECEVLKELLRATEQEGNSWSVVSVSWSRSYIAGAMMGAELVEPRDAPGLVNKIHCNELSSPVKMDGTKGPIGLICDRRDKLAQLEAVIDTASIPHIKHWSARNMTILPIYVGDSTTDIDCLAYSRAIGIHINQGEPEHPVWQMLDDMKVEIRSVASLPTHHAIHTLNEMKKDLGEQDKPPHIVCSIQSFAELRDWIAKLD